MLPHIDSSKSSSAATQMLYSCNLAVVQDGVQWFLYITGLGRALIKGGWDKWSATLVMPGRSYLSCGDRSLETISTPRPLAWGSTKTENIHKRTHKCSNDLRDMNFSVLEPRWSRTEQVQCCSPEFVKWRIVSCRSSDVLMKENVEEVVPVDHGRPCVNSEDCLTDLQIRRWL